MVVPPDLDRLREARAQVGGPTGKSWGGDHFLVRQEMVEAIDFLLSVLDEGGRLVVEQPCEHGNDWLACDTEDCPAGSYVVVWPPKEGE